MTGRRVLQVIDSLAPAGAEQSLAALAPHLVADGIDLHVAYLVERDGLRDVVEGAGVPVHSLAEGGRSRRRWFTQTSDLVAGLWPAVVHTTLFEADLAGRRAAARHRVPCVSSLVNSTYGPEQARREDVSRVRLRAAQAADIATARRVRRFHAVTGYVADVMARRLLVPRDRIEVIHRGRDADLLGVRTPERRAATRRRLGVTDDAELVVAVGRHEPQKGLDVLIEALPAVRARRPGVRVVVAGREGRATAALRALVDSTGQADAVTFLGMRDDVPDLLAAGDVFAFPSRWEGAGGTLIEAMALECPIVTSSLATLLETVDATTAELVAPGSADDLARGLLAVLDAPGPARARASAARTRFVEEFTVEVSAQRMAALYDRVAGVGTRTEARHG